MKSLSLAVALTFVLTALPAEATPPRSNVRQLTLHLTKSERSKDAHSSRYKIDINQHSATYSGPIPGTCIRGRCSHGTWTFTLTQEQQEKLWNKIRSNGLLKSFSEKKTGKGLGNYVSLTVRVKKGTQQYKGVVTGKTNRWAGGGGGGLISKAAKKYVSGASSIRYLVFQWAPIPPPRKK
jgi:hypothetical protein